MTAAADRAKVEHVDQRPTSGGGAAVEAADVDALLRSGRFLAAESRVRADLLESERAGASPSTLRQRGRNHYLLARALEGQGRLEEALAAALEAMRSAGGNPEVHRTAARLYLANHRPEEAVRTYRQGIRLAEEFAARSGRPVPGLHRWRYELARALRSAGAEEEARRELDLYRREQERELELKRLERRAAYRPDSAEHQVEYAQALRRARRFADAVSVFRRALALDDRHAESHWGLALTVLDRGAPSGDDPNLLAAAEHHTRRALEIEVAAGSCLAAAKLAAVRGQTSSARGWIARALELAPSDPEVLECARSLELRDP